MKFTTSVKDEHNVIRPSKHFVRKEQEGNCDGYILNKQSHKVMVMSRKVICPLDS